MNLSNVLFAARRRWYLIIAGLMAAAALAGLAYNTVQPTYTRDASVVLIPDKASVPDGGNPYLYIGGLSQAADVLARAASSQTVLDPIVKADPGSTVQIQRDASTSGPVIAVSVNTPDAAGAGPTLDRALAAISSTLTELQDKEHLPADRRITVSQLAADTKNTAETKTQLIATGAAAIAGVAATLMLTLFIDGLMLSRSQRSKKSTPEVERGRARRAGATLIMDGEVLARRFPSAAFEHRASQ